MIPEVILSLKVQSLAVENYITISIRINLATNLLIFFIL